MARLTPPCTPLNPISGDSYKRWSSLIESINTFFARLKKHAAGGRGATKKMGTYSPKSPLAKPKQLFVNLSNKASHFRYKNNKKVDQVHEAESEADQLDFGDGGLWQRNILMGDKCQPLDFSGVIYYDSKGKQLPELPMRSPRASPLPSYLYASSEKY